MKKVISYTASDGSSYTTKNEAVAADFRVTYKTVDSVLQDADNAIKRLRSLLPVKPRKKKDRAQFIYSDGVDSTKDQVNNTTATAVARA